VKPKVFLAHLSVLSANLFYGANYSIAKLVMPEYIKPFGFIVIRVVVTTVLFWIAGMFIRDSKVLRKDLLRMFFCAVFGVALNQLLFFKGLDLTTPINAALMMTTNPIMVLVAASMLIGERITGKKILGILTGITGACALLLWGKQVSFHGASAAGDAMVLVNSLSFGIFLIMVKPLMLKYHTLTVMKWVFLFGTILVVPFGYNEFREVEWHTFTNSTWAAVAYVVIGVTALAYLLNVYALKNLSPPSVSVYIYLQPLFAFLFAFLLGKDRLNTLHLIAALLIFTGVYLVTSGRKAALK
jgi:drug/metabolite transporter (DMT)-like permease